LKSVFNNIEHAQSYNNYLYGDKAVLNCFVAGFFVQRFVYERACHSGHDRKGEQLYAEQRYILYSCRAQLCRLRKQNCYKAAGDRRFYFHSENKRDNGNVNRFSAYTQKRRNRAEGKPRPDG